MSANQSQREARIASLIAKARPGWRFCWSEQYPDMVYLDRGMLDVDFASAVGFGNGNRPRAMLDAVERAHAKGWR